MKKLLLSLFTIASLSLTAQNLDEGLIAFYPFDGDAKDYSGNGKHGTVSGAVLTEGVDGKPNTAYNFELGSIDVDASLFFSNSVTISAWVMMDESSKWCSGLFYGWESGDYGSLTLGLENQGGGPNWFALTCTLSVCDGSEELCSFYESNNYPSWGGTNIVRNEWHHIIYEIGD